jgi:hypothetical protein
VCDARFVRDDAELTPSPAGQLRKAGERAIGIADREGRGAVLASHHDLRAGAQRSSGAERDPSASRSGVSPNSA